MGRLKCFSRPIYSFTEHHIRIEITCQTFTISRTHIRRNVRKNLNVCKIMSDNMLCMNKLLYLCTRYSENPMHSMT